MNCAITVEQQLKFHKKVFGDLREMVGKSLPFELYSYANDIFGTINNKTNDPILAQSYVQLLPTVIIQTAAFDKTLSRLIKDKYSDLVDKQDLFEDFNEVVKFISPTVSEDTINQIKKDIVEKSESNKVVAIPLTDEQLTINEKGINEFVHKPDSALTTTGQQGLIVNGQWTNIPNPEEAFYYDFLSLVGDALDQKADITGEELTINNHTGFKLKVVPASLIPDNKLRESTKRLLSGNEMDKSGMSISAQRGRELHNKGIAIVITNNDGEILNFDSSYNITIDNTGKPIYFHTRSPFLAANGRYSINSVPGDPGSLQTPEEIARNKNRDIWDNLSTPERNILTEIEDRAQQAQLDQLYKIRQYINSSPDHFIVSILSGVSRGFVELNFDKWIPTRSINFEGSTIKFDPIIPLRAERSLGEESMGLYIRRPYGKSIPLKSNNLTNDQVNRVVSLLFDELYIDTSAGPEIISPSKIKHLIESFVYTGPEGLQINIKNNELAVRVNSVFLDLRNKELAKEIVKNKLTEGYASVSERANAIKEGRDIVRNPRFRHNYGSVNFDRNLINQGYYDSFKIEGNKVVIEEANYLDFIKENTTTNVRPNEEGKIIPLNGYIKFDLPEYEKSKLGIVAYKVEEIDSPILKPNTDINAIAPLVLDSPQISIAELKSRRDIELKQAELNWRNSRDSKGFPTYSLQPIEDEINKKYEVEISALETREDNKTIDQTEPFEDNRSLDEKLNDLELDKSIHISNKATPKQVLEAKKWYDKSPLSKYFPYEQAFNIVNSNAFATWTSSGIKLYSGSNYTDLYHEAWHGFSQFFLTKKEKADLYKELQGSKKVYNKLSNLDLEEIIAEDFRKYILSGGKVILDQRATRNTLFRRILNFLKKLFIGVSIQDNVISQNTILKVKELYDNLYVGNINQYNPSSFNVDFGLLNKGIIPLGEEKRVGLNYEESMLVVKSIDSMISQFINDRNASSGSNKWTSVIFRQPEAVLPLIYESIKGQFEKMREDFISKDSESYSRVSIVMQPHNVKKIINNTKVTTLRSSEQALKIAIGVGESKIANFGGKDFLVTNRGNLTIEQAGGKEAIIKSEGLNSESEFMYNQTKEWVNGKGSLFVYDINPITHYSSIVQGNIRILDEVLTNFGDITNSLIGDQVEGVVSYHLNKSEYLQFNPKNIDAEQIGIITSEDIEATRFDRKGNEVSMKDMAANEVLYLVKSIRSFDNNGRPVLNRLGIRELANFRLTWARLIKALEGNPSPQDMYKSLLEESRNFPVFKEIIEKLGSPSTTEKSSFNLWTKFWQAFNLANIPLYQVNVVETNETDETGDVSTIYKVLVGQASAVFRNVERDFKSYFVTTETEKFINSTRSGNILNTKGILEKYKGGTRNKEFEFIRDLGMPVTDVPQVREGIRKLVNTGFIYDKLVELDKASIPIKDIIQSLREETVVFEKGFPTKKLASENTNINTILSLQVKYSGVYSNSAVTNAEGNSQYEQSLNSSVTVIQSAINSAQSFDDLVKIPHMSHLSLDRNPFSKSSIWLNSIFDMKDLTGGRPRRKDVKFEIINLGGVQTIRDDVADYSYSTGTSNADKYTKLLQDIYLTIHTGRPAVMTHADKGTVLSMKVSKLNSPVSDSTDLYVDTEDFLITPPGSLLNNGYNSAMRLVVPYIQSEIDRIRRVESGSEKSIPGYTTPDSKGITRGTTFTIFDGVFTEDTKNGLLSIESTLESYFKNPSDESIALYRKLQQELSEYFNNSIADTRAQLGDMLYLDQNIKDKVKTLASDPRGKYNIQDKLTDKQIEDTILKSYTVNTFIHNIESLAIVYGDLALYNMSKEEFHKRNAAVASTGYLFRTDQSALDYVNNIVGRLYRKSIGLPERTFNGSFNSVVFRENTVQSVLIPEYTEALKSTLRLKYPKKSDKEILDQVEGILAPYKGMDEGDAQGWITIDAYRIAMELEGKWTRLHENLYNRIINGENITTLEVTEFFPPRKYQYFGPLLESTGLPVTAFHKFSLFPLIPSVIKDKNMHILQENLERNEADYALFQSGSKVGTLVDSNTNKPDILYSDKDRRTVAVGTTYTKNTIRLEFLKDQLDIAPKFKGKVIFSTQLRKLIEEGLLEGGVPVDFKPELSVNDRRKAWYAITSSTPSQTETLRNEASNFYGKYKRYEDNISKLIEVKKLELLKEAGWDFNSEGEPVGDITKLLEMVKAEMSRQDLGDNEIDFLQTNSNGTLKYDLSISLSADKIERVLTALVNNRLIRQKVNGEGLVQLSNSLMEPSDPTDEDREKWGTSDLKSYRKDPSTGKTLPMEVKIAIQGNFEYLLNLKDIDNKRVGTLERLNQVIKNPEWLSNKDNLKLITMVAVRIPVQGLNSMEFMQVKEFLPKEAGNIIVPPSEIVAKSGSDFDIDKLTVMMPSIGLINSRPEVYKSIPTTSTQEDLRVRRVELRKIRKDIKDKYNEIFSNRKSSSEFLLTDSQIDNLENLKSDYLKKRSKLNRSIDTLNQEWLTIYNGEKNYFTVKRLSEVEQLLYNLENERDNLSNDQYDIYRDLIKQEHDEKVNTQRDEELSVVEVELAKVERQLQALDVKATENELIFNIKEILEMPHNFVSLITPNDTNLVKPLADELKNLREYDPTKGSGKVSSTRVLEPAYNIYKHESNSVGKQTLGLGAVDNTYNTIFNRVGALMNPIWSTPKGAKRRADIFLPHNELEILKGEFKGQNGISLSHLYDANKENKIADVINQMMNGWVDVAKDAWIFDIQGNKEIAPTLLFMIQAGVPLKTAVYFVSNSLVKNYVEQRRKMRSVFSRPLSMNASEFSLTDYTAKIEVLKGFFVDADLKSNALYKKTVELVNEGTTKDLFSEDKLLANITDSKSDSALAGFLHFLELEELAKGPRELKLKLNYDTSKSTTLFDAQRAEANLQKLSEETKIPSYVVQSVLDESPIGSFRIQPFQLTLWGELFKLRNHPNFNNFLIEKLGNSDSITQMKKTFGDEEVFISNFRNDFVVAIFLGAIKNYDPNSSTYKGITLDSNVKIEDIKHSSRGALVKEENGVPTILIDKEVLDTQFSKVFYSGQKQENVSPINRIKYNKYSYESQGLAPVNASAFIYDGEARKSEYYNFVIEREYLRYQLPFKQLAKTIEFKNKFSGRVNSDLYIVKDGVTETTQEFEIRIATEIYEEILRDKALDNILNFWKLFRSPNNVASEFTRIKESYPDIAKEYSLVRDLIVNEGSGISNLKLKDSRLAGDDINTYYENMLRLSDSNIPKVDINSEESKLENDRISEFFSRLPLYAMLQSGLNATDSLSIGRIMPADKIASIMQLVMDKTINTLNDTKKAHILLERFWNKFIQHNSRGNIKTRRRIKDYVMSEKHSINIFPKGLEEVEGKSNMYTFFESDGDELVKLINEDPEVSFILEDGTNDSNIMTYNKKAYRNRDNMKGITTRNSSSSKPDSLWDDTTFEINKSIIDESLSKINDLYTTNKRLAFSKLGYGQYMLDPISENSPNLRAPKTFSYLSKRLYEMFDYINPRAKLVTDVQNIINQQQEDILNISDVMLRNKIRSEIFDVLYNKDNNCQI